MEHSETNLSRTVAPAKTVAEVFKQGFYSYSPEEITAMRKKLCMSQEEFAELLFVEKSTIAKWQQGKRLPSTPAMRLMQFVEVIADEKHTNINHRIRKTYR